MSELEFFVPVRTHNDLNCRQGWRIVWSRGKRQRTATATIAATQATQEQLPEKPLVVLLTRVGRGLMDDDNLQGALKHVRDGIADWLGVDDRHRHIVRYEYAQERGKEYGVRVRITSASGEREAAQ